MLHTPDTPSAAFGDLVASALDRSVETSLNSLHSLRDAVQAYTRNEKHKGASLDGVMRAIASLLIEAEDDRGSTNEPPTRDPKLARQLRAWCSEHYTSLE